MLQPQAERAFVTVGVILCVAGALAIGGMVGLILSVALLRLNILPLSFAEGGPLLDVEKEQLKREHPNLMTIRATDRPKGWVGKCWAVQQGVEYARNLKSEISDPQSLLL